MGGTEKAERVGQILRKKKCGYSVDQSDPVDLHLNGASLKSNTWNKQRRFIQCQELMAASSWKHIRGLHYNTASSSCSVVKHDAERPGWRPQLQTHGHLRLNYLTLRPNQVTGFQTEWDDDQN